jgi:hypothetical protein
MIEKNKGEEIVEILGNPKRAKNLFALNKRLERCEMMIKDNDGKLTHQDFKVINDYKKDCAIQENALITELKKLELKNSNLTPQQFTKQRMELMDKHQERYRQIISGNYEGTIIDKNIQKNSEEIVRNEELNKEFDRLFPPLKPFEFAELQRTNSEQEQQKTLWSDGVHIPGIHPPRPKLKPRVYFANESFVTNQNLSVILASPGTGKSSICESILASVLNKDCDTLSFKVDEDVQRAIYFDTERDLSMIDRSNERMLQRANVSEHLENALVVGLRENFSVKDKKEKIIQVIEHYQPQLILIDGVSDLMSNTNSEEETNLIIEWLNKIITHYNLSLITTLHPNKGTDTARGWIGSEMLRKCEGVILVKENVDEIRTMSVTKARDSAKPKASFKWCNESSRMMSCEHNAKVGAIKKLNIIDALSNLELEQLKKSIGIGFEFKYNELTTAIKKYLNEEHPDVAQGTNMIGVFIKDMNVKNMHIVKQGKTPKTTYQFKVVN